MCGIAGFFTPLSSRPLPEESSRRLQQALRRLRLRGPDAQGICQNRHWALAHRRLAIMDPGPDANQPWVHAATGTTLVYNGEIYNFLDLRRILAGRGYSFRTRCDTEVVMAAYLEWGEKCVEKFLGCFAFALVDPVGQRLLLARDRLGVKPLFYAESDAGVAFASTVVALAPLLGGECRIELPALSHFLTTGKLTLGDRSLVAGLRLLPPGAWRSYRASDGAAREHRYWRLPRLSPAAKADAPPFATAVASTRELLEDAVARRLQSDVPLGAFLSGGLDSATIAWIAAHRRHSPPPFFCAGSDDPRLNEFHHARSVAAQLGADVAEVTVDADDFAAHWQFLIREKGLPLATPNEVSIYRLAKALRQQCKVTLTGEGADEVFAGYTLPQFGAFDFDRCGRQPHQAIANPDLALAMQRRYGRTFFINEVDYYLATTSWVRLADKDRLLAPDLWDALDDDGELCAFYEDFFADLEGLSSFDKFMHLHCRFNLESLLLRVDSSTMAASVEARVPYTDHRLVELAFAMPDHYRMDFRDPAARARAASLTVADIDEADLLETKRLPRQAFADRLPASILQRRKMSFPVPFADWFGGPLADWLRERCLDSRLAREAFAPGALEGLFASRDARLWPVANACLWWDEMQAQPAADSDRAVSLDPAGADATG